MYFELIESQTQDRPAMRRWREWGVSNEVTGWFWEQLALAFKIETMRSHETACGKNSVLELSIINREPGAVSAARLLVQP